MEIRLPAENPNQTAEVVSMLDYIVARAYARLEARMETLEQMGSPIAGAYQMLVETATASPKAVSAAMADARSIRSSRLVNAVRTVARIHMDNFDILQPVSNWLETSEKIRAAIR